MLLLEFFNHCRTFQLYKITWKLYKNTISLVSFLFGAINVKMYGYLNDVYFGLSYLFNYEILDSFSIYVNKWCFFN